MEIAGQVKAFVQRVKESGSKGRRDQEEAKGYPLPLTFIAT